MNTYTTFDRMYMLLTEALEGVYLDPEQTLYVNLEERMASVEEDSIAEVCDEWDTMTVGEFLSVVVEYRTSEYGGYQTEIPTLLTNSQTATRRTFLLREGLPFYIYFSLALYAPAARVAGEITTA